MSDLVGNPEDRFSHVMANMVVSSSLNTLYKLTKSLLLKDKYLKT